MTLQFYLLLILVFVVIAGLFLWLNAKLTSLSQNKSDPSLLEWLKSSNDRLDHTASVLLGVQKSLGEMSEIGRSMKDLQDFLRSPKLRGNLGEQVLKELLSQTLPKQTFHFQYTFKSGAIVDAAIKTEAGIIPIDSKFPIDNFRKILAADNQVAKDFSQKEFSKDVKKHIDAIAGKYILPSEGTLDYALMYIPSEAVYYEIMSNLPELADYAHSQRVLPVSPSTLYAYLRAILMSFEGQKIAHQAQEILFAIRAIQKDYTRVEGSLGVLGHHLQNAYNQMSTVSSNFNSLGQKISSTKTLPDDEQEVKKLI